MNMKAEAFREYKKAAKVITHSNLPYVMTRIIKLYPRKKEEKELTSHIPGCTLDGCFAFNGRRGFGPTVTVWQGIQMIYLKKRSPFSFYPMILNFDILEYLKVYATKACDEYFECSFIQALHFHTSKKLAINISKSTYSPVSKLTASRCRWRWWSTWTRRWRRVAALPSSPTRSWASCAGGFEEQ